MSSSHSDRIVFTKEMRRDHTILMPMMAPTHFELIKNVMCNAGYKLELLTNCGHSVVEEGLKYVHNDTCYPALLVIGQMIDALKSGKYDLSKTALLMSQTGGGCRASNYIHLMRKAMAKAGYGDLPIISANLSGLEENPGFQITLPMIRKLMAALLYGDMMMLLSNQIRPYENEKGAADALVASWTKELSSQFNAGRGLSTAHMKENFDKISDSFAKIKITRVPKVRVGVVGEIYVKYASLANNSLEGFLAEQDCEVMVPGLLSFVMFKVDNRLEDHKLYGGNIFKYAAVKLFMSYLTKIEGIYLSSLKRHSQFNAPAPYQHLKSMINGIVGYGSKMGEGWLLTAEMVELIISGYGNIVCTQPFGCLPNHINGKGMIHRLREIYGDASNIVAIDYDPSATRVNQENRIKLMLAVAKERLFEQSEAAAGAAEHTPSAEYGIKPAERMVSTSDYREKQPA